MSRSELFEAVFENMCHRNSDDPFAKVLYEVLRILEETKWIPRSERLPERGESVLLCDLDGDIYIGHLATGCNYYYADFCYDRIKNVTAWMLLPEPYKEVEHE